MSSVSMSQPPIEGAAAADITRPPPAAGSCMSIWSLRVSFAKSAAPPPGVTTSAASVGPPPARTVAPPRAPPLGTAPAAGTADASTASDEPTPARVSARWSDQRRPSAASTTTVPPGAGAADTSSTSPSVRSAVITAPSARLEVTIA